MREIHDTGAAPEIHDTAIGASCFRNPSIDRILFRFLSDSFAEVYQLLGISTSQHLPELNLDFFGDF